MNEASTAFDFRMIIEIISGVLLSMALLILFIVSLIRSIVKRSKGWVMTAVFSGLIGLSLLGTGIYFAASRVADEFKKSSQPKIFQTSDGVATLVGQGSWKKLNLDSPAASLKIGNLIAEEYLVVITEPRIDFEKGFTCKQFADLAVETSSKVIKSPKVAGLAPITINGLSAYQTRITGSVGGVSVDYLNTYVQGKKHFHQILAWTLPSKRRVAFPKFKNAVATFHEVSKNTSPDLAR